MRNALFAVVAVAPLSLAQPGPGHDVVRETAAIDWPAYQAALQAGAPHSERTRAGANIEDAVRETQLPVLLATHQDVRAAPDFQTQGTSYVAHYRLGPPEKAIEISVLGSASHLVAPLPRAKSSSRSAPYHFEVIDDITDLSFTRFGASYTIRASCTDEADPRCKKPEYLLGFMRSLIPVKR